MSGFKLLTLDNQVFATYAFYASVLALKMFLMSILTGRLRMSKLVFANPEDAKMDPKGKVKLDDPDIERVRRGHLNDIENILPFFIVALLYVLTDPSKWLAIQLIRAFAVSRILHTFVYVICPLPQPSRGLAWMIGYAINIYMVIQVVLTVPLAF